MQAHYHSKDGLTERNEEIWLAKRRTERRRGSGLPHEALGLAVSTELNDFSLGHVLLPLMTSNLAKGTDKVLSQQDKVMSITDTAKAQKLFEEAFPIWRYGSVKAAITEAYRFCSRRVVKEFTYRRARTLKEGKARRIDGEEMEALKAARIEEHKREQFELRARLAALDEILAAADPVAASASVESQGAEVR